MTMPVKKTIKIGGKRITLIEYTASSGRCKFLVMQVMRMFWCNENRIAQIELVAQEGCNVFDETVCTLSTQNKL